MRGALHQMATRLRRLALLLALALGLVFGPRSVRAGDGTDGERLLAIYLPGVYFAQLESKVELGHALATHIATQLGDRFRLTPRVYATLEAMDADASRIVVGLVESPLIAQRLTSLQPVSVAVATGSGETRLHVLCSGAIKSLADLRGSKLFYALPLDNPQSFFENAVFEGELQLSRDRLAVTRDVYSLLSLASLRKADAVVLYEEDAAQTQKSGLRTIYTSAALPRPTLAVFERRLNATDVSRLREAMALFHSPSQPQLRGFRATGEGPYQLLRQRAERRPRRLPPLLELDEDAAPLPLPQAPSSAPRVPLTTYAPEVD